MQYIDRSSFKIVVEISSIPLLFGLRLGVFFLFQKDLLGKDKLIGLLVDANLF